MMTSDMDCFDTLRTQHHRIRRLLEQARAAGPGADQHHALSALQTEVERHLSLEEDVVFPALAEYHDLKMRVYPFWEAHDAIRRELKTVLSMEHGDGRFRTALSELVFDIEDHLKNEDLHVYPQAREMLSEQWLEQVARDLEAEISKRRTAA